MKSLFKSLIAACVFLFSLNCNATIFTLINETYMAEGYVQIKEMGYPTGLSINNASYNIIGSVPLNGQAELGLLSFGNFPYVEAKSFASRNKVDALYNNNGAPVPVTMYAHSFAKTDLVFSPNFDGLGLINFNAFGTLWSYASVKIIRVSDDDTKETLFYKTTRDIIYPDGVFAFSYNEWNHDSRYELEMIAWGADFDPTDGHAGVSNDMKFNTIPEPPTILLLILGLFGFARISKR